MVPWVEGMNLAQGLIAAQYSAYWDPRTITVTRNGIPYKVDVKKFCAAKKIRSCSRETWSRCGGKRYSANFFHG